MEGPLRVSGERAAMSKPLGQSVREQSVCDGLIDEFLDLVPQNECVATPPRC